MNTSSPDTWPITLMKGQQGQLIDSIEVEGLFGLYDYKLPENGSFSDAGILYGDNGVGKSTVLRLTFHLLSAADNRYHRTFLYNTVFSKLTVVLSSGISLKAEKLTEANTDITRLTIRRGNKIAAGWDYVPPNKRSESRQAVLGENLWIEDAEYRLYGVSARKARKASLPYPNGETAYLTALKETAPIMFLLNADRRLDSDAVADPDDELELRRLMRFEEAKRLNDLVARAREIALSQALLAATKWLGGKALMGNAQGSMNVHSAYVAISQKLLAPTLPEVDPDRPKDIPALLDRLKYIEKRTSELARYELATPLSTSEFNEVLNTTNQETKNLAVGFLEPYVGGLEERLKALEPTFEVVDRFVTLINGFLKDKELEFRLSEGFKIKNPLGHSLSPAQLSSGEQQLILLFCYVIVARDMPTVFIIDEPEISLNIKWQRQLVQALLDLTSGAQVQFLFASHSMELLAQHRRRVVKMRRIDKNG